MEEQLISIWDRTQVQRDIIHTEAGDRLTGNKTFEADGMRSAIREFNQVMREFPVPIAESSCIRNGIRFIRIDLVILACKSIGKRMNG